MSRRVHPEWWITAAAALGLGLVVIWSRCAHAEEPAKRDPKVAADFQRLHPCPSTGKPAGACPGWVRDHRVPLCAGGPDAVENLQWEATDQSYVKDVLERRLCALMSRYDELAAQCRAP